MQPLRPFVVCLVLILGAAGLSGCLGVQQVSAQEAQQAADGAARSWDPEARLVFAAGLEGRVDNEALRALLEDSWLDAFGLDSFDAGDGESLWDRIEKDPHPGNGRTQAWLLHYAPSQGEREFVVLVDGDKQVAHSEERPASMESQAVEDYTVDSDEAMRIAKRENAELRQVMDAKNLLIGAGLLLDPEHGGPVWTISAVGGGLRSGVSGGFVQVDAMTGEVILSEGDSFY